MPGCSTLYVTIFRRDLYEGMWHCRNGPAENRKEEGRKKERYEPEKLADCSKTSSRSLSLSPLEETFFSAPDKLGPSAAACLTRPEDSRKTLLFQTAEWK